MSQDLWSKLESQFEEQAVTPVEIPASVSAGPEKPSIKESFATSYLNGFIPTVLICALGFRLTGTVQGHYSGIGAEVVLLLPLVWLLRPFLFKGNKPSSAFLLSVPFVLGGFTEVFGVGTNLLGRWVKSELKDFNEFQLIQTVQDHLEGYLSFSHFGLYLLAGVLLLASYRKVETTYYWLDLKPTNKVRVGLANLLTLVLPTLALVLWATALWQHPWTEREKVWLAEMQEVTAAMPVEYFEHPYVGEVETHEIGASIQTLKAPPYPKRTKDQSLLIERNILKSLPHLLTDPQASKEEVLKTKQLMEQMAEYPDNLEAAHRWALASLQLHLIHDNYTPYTVGKLFLNEYLTRLATVPLSELESDPTWNLDSTIALLQDPKPADYGIHRCLIRQMGWQTFMVKPEFAEQSTIPNELRPMNIFGHTVHTTPLKVYSRWHSRPILTWWLDFKSSHPVENATELADIALQERDRLPIKNSMLTGTSLVLQELDRAREKKLLTLARLILELRKDHESTGIWNKDVHSLAKERDLDLENIQVRFDPKTGELDYGQKHFWPHSSITWKLQ